MKPLHFFLLLLCAFGISVGQILLKLAARSIGQIENLAGAVNFVLNGYFLAALVVYGTIMVLWVWLLSIVTLTQAYPAIAAAFVFTPILAYLFLREPIGLGYFAGIALICAGLYLILR